MAEPYIRLQRDASKSNDATSNHPPPDVTAPRVFCIFIAPFSNNEPLVNADCVNTPVWLSPVSSGVNLYVMFGNPALFTDELSPPLLWLEFDLWD